MSELAEHHRCLASTCKRDHGELVNKLLQIGGTIKIENWKTSHRYQQLVSELAEHHRCLASTCKRDHGELVNKLLQIGGTIKIEKNSYLSYQRNFLMTSPVKSV